MNKNLIIRAILKPTGLLCMSLVMLLSEHAHAGLFFNSPMQIIKPSAIPSNAFMQSSDQTNSNVEFTDDPTAEGWLMEYEHKFVLIPVGDVLSPIEIKKPTVILKHKDRGWFSYSQGKMLSATRTPVVNAPSISGTYGFRPTLFITIRGGSIEPSDNVGWISNIQQIIANLANSSYSRHSQYLHMQVDWDADERISRQVEAIGEVVNDFLDDREFAWDVVIIGYSRGGVFAHELTREIVANTNIEDLHTFLLDPTPAWAIGDYYPRYKYEASGTRHYGSLFYNGTPFAEVAEITTEGDQPIPGYTNYGRGVDDHMFNSSHVDFAFDWVADPDKGLERAMSDIWALKDSGEFSQDGKGGWEVVKVREEDVYFDANVQVTDSNVYVDGTVNAGLAQANMSAMAGKDGAEISAAMLVTSAQVVIREDQATISDNNLLSTTAATISEDGANGHVSVLGADADMRVGSGSLYMSHGLANSNAGSVEVSDSGGSIHIGEIEILSW